MSCQCLRSLSYWSGGLKNTETSILNAYYHLIEKSEYCNTLEKSLIKIANIFNDFYAFNYKEQPTFFEGSIIMTSIIKEI